MTGWTVRIVEDVDAARAWARRENRAMIEAHLAWARHRDLPRLTEELERRLEDET